MRLTSHVDFSWSLDQNLPSVPTSIWGRFPVGDTEHEVFGADTSGAEKFDLVY
jgi:hypothetical protein